VPAGPGRKEAYQHYLAPLTPDSVDKLDPEQQLVATYIASRARYWADSSYDATWLWKGTEPNELMIRQLFDFTVPYILPTEPQSNAPPALVALGKFDFTVPPTVWENRPVPFQHFTKVVFDSSGHTPQLEQPAAFDARVEEWLATLPKS